MNEKIKILHLEDTPEDAELIKRHLWREGLLFEEMVVDNKSAFISALKDFLPDIVISDHCLPTLDSFEALKLTRQYAEGLPFILVTGNVPDENAVNIIKEGAFDYILKDRLQRLPSAIMHALEHTRLEAEKKKYLEKVIADEELMNEAESLARLGSWQTDLVTYKSHWSDEAFRVFGYEPGEIEASFDLFLKHVHPDDLPYVQQMTSDAMLVNDRISFEFRITDKNNQLKYIRNEIRVDRDRNGKPVHLIGFNLDITETVKAEANVEKKERFYKALIEKSADMKILIGPECRIIFGSPSVSLIMGFKPADYLLKDPFDFVHPDFAEPLRDLIESLMLHPGHSKFTQLRILKHNGSWGWFEGNITNMLHEPDVNAFVINFRDITERKNVEQQILESERKYRDLFEDNPMPMWVVERKTLKFLNINRAAVRHYGYSTEEFLTMTALDVRPSEAKKRLQEWDKYSPKGSSNTGLWKHIRKNGSEIIADVFADNIIFEGKEAWLVLCIDVTEKKKAEESLRQSQVHLLASQRIGNIGSWEQEISENDGLIFGKTLWSDQTYRIFGYEPGEIEACTEFFFSKVYPDDLQKVTESLSKSLRDGEIYKLEHRIIRRDGEIRVLQNRAEVTLDPQTGKAIKMTGTILDITEKKLSDEELNKYEANLRTIFESTDTAYLLLDTSLKVISFNKRASEGFKEVTHISLHTGFDYLSFLTPERREERLKVYNRVLKGESINYEAPYTQPGSEEKWFDMRLSPVFDSGKKILGMVMAITDISTRKREEIERQRMIEDISQRNRNLEQFTYIVSHNLRGPLSNIIGSSNILKDEKPDEEDLDYLINGIFQSAAKLDNVILDLNNILQVKQMVNEKKEEVVFAELVNDIRASASHAIKDQNVEIITDFSAAQSMSGVKSYLYSIFYNLISNSIKYRKPDVPPVITISTQNISDGINIFFKDNGIGLDMNKIKDQVFGLYKRFHLHTEGKGMGLFMVKTQVEALGGKIRLFSEENKGCEFIISFKK